MKGMKDFIDKEKEKERDLVIQNINKIMESKPTYTNNNNNNAININPSQNKIPEISHLKNKNSKDLKDYIETQKMMIELEKLQNDELVDDNDYEDEPLYENNYDILNEFKELDEYEIAAEDNFYNNLYGNFEQEGREVIFQLIF